MILQDRLANRLQDMDYEDTFISLENEKQMIFTTLSNRAPLKMCKH